MWRAVMAGPLGGRIAAKSPEAAMLRQLCELYDLSCRAIAAAKEKPLDVDNRLAVKQYGDAVQKLGAKFGITPIEAARVAEYFPPEEKPEDSIPARARGAEEGRPEEKPAAD